MNHTIQDIHVNLLDDDGTKAAMQKARAALKRLAALADDVNAVSVFASILAPPERSPKGKLLYLANYLVDLQDQATAKLSALHAEHAALVEKQTWLFDACAKIVIHWPSEKYAPIERAIAQGQEDVTHRRKRLTDAGLHPAKAVLEVPDFDRAKLEEQLSACKQTMQSAELFLKTRNEDVITPIRHLPEFEHAYQRFHPAPPPAPVVPETTESKLNKLMASVFGEQAITPKEAQA